MNPTIVEIDTYLSLQPYSNRTRSNYRYQIQRCLKWCDRKGLSLKEFGPSDFLQYCDENRWKQGSSMRRVAYLSMLGFLRWKMGKHSPFENLRVDKPKPRPQRTLTVNELNKILSALHESSLNAETLKMRRIGTRDIAIVSLLADTGLRTTELCSLKLCGVDLDNQRALVRGKRGRWRYPVFSQITGEQLRRWLSVRGLVAKPDVDYLFVSISGNTPGRGLAPIGLECIMKRIARDSGVKRFSPMALRRAMATILIRNGAPTHLVQVQGGWTEPRHVETYTRTLAPSDIAPFFAST